MKKLNQLSWILLIYTVLVILWGAWVRISHSGNGCGDTWPLCHGQLIPVAQQGKTWVEYGHRLTSGVFGIFVVYIYILSKKNIQDPKHPIRRMSLTVLIFMIVEALLGAKLVLFGLVGSNDSAYRVFVMALHQVNSLLLSGSVCVLTLYTREELKNKLSISKTDKKPLLPLLFFILIAITGAWAALSSTLFPSESLWQGLQSDFAPESHYLVRLRIIHPITAILIGGTLAIGLWWKSQNVEVSDLKKVSLQTSLVLIAGLVFGMLTLFLLAPVWMKITHLMIAHIIWFFLIYWNLVRTEKIKP